MSVSNHGSALKLSPQGMASLLAAAAVVVHREEKALKEQLRPAEDRVRTRPEGNEARRDQATQFLGRRGSEERRAASVDERRAGASGGDTNLQNEIKGRMVAWNLEKQRRAR